MSNNGSMAVWCQPRANAENSTAEIHFNYWRLTRQSRFQGKSGYPARDFAEVGILLHRPDVVETVCVYLPLPLTRADVSDCGPYFARVDIAQGIFNEPLTATSVGPPGPRRVELVKNGVHFCHVYEFSTDAGGVIDPGQLLIVPYGAGTLLTIPREAIDEVRQDLPEGCPAYFRLRSYVPKNGRPFVSLISPVDRRFQSSFEEVEYIDFRLNEARTLPDNIERLMRAQRANQISFPLVAFLTAMPVASDLTVSSQETHKIRLLEHDLWDNYVPSGIPEGMVVYHWRKNKNPGVEDFSAFVKLRTRRSDKTILLTYLIVAFLFGVFGNLAAAGIQAGLTYLCPLGSDDGPPPLPKE